MAHDSFYDAVYRWVKKIPKGRVASYGQVATWLGAPRAARAVGYALFFVNDPSVPWQRVVNAKGEISIGGATSRPELQRKLLIGEGVCFDGAGRIDLRRFMYMPRTKPVRWDLHKQGAKALIAKL